MKRDVTKRENMKDLILKEIDEDMTPQEFRANELAMKAFGLLAARLQPARSAGPGLLGGGSRLL